MATYDDGSCRPQNRRASRYAVAAGCAPKQMTLIRASE